MSEKLTVVLACLVIVPLAVVLSYLTFGGILVRESVSALVLIQGGLFVAMILGVIGSVKLSKALLITVSIIFLAESIPLMFDGLFVLTLLPAFYFLWMSLNPRYFFGKLNQGATRKVA